VTASGYLITCHHVIKDMDQCKPHLLGPRVYCIGVGTPVEWTYEAELVHLSSRPGLMPQRADDPMLDLAVLRVTRRLSGSPVELEAFEPLAFADSDRVAEGDGLWVIGYGQQQSDMTNTRNTMTGWITGRHSAADGDWIRFSPDILSGHSGAPAVDRYGQVVAWCVKSQYDMIGANTTTGRSAIQSQRYFSATGGLHQLRPVNSARLELQTAGVVM